MKDSEKRSGSLCKQSCSVLHHAKRDFDYDYDVDDGSNRTRKTMLRVEGNDAVKWQCDKYKTFTVHFGWNTPFKEEQIHSDPSTGMTKSLQVPADVRNGHYRFIVAVLAGNEIWADDPEIIIIRPSG